MTGPPGGDPFSALGLPARPDLTDDEVRSAWRRVAAASHPDRADGGDPGRFAVAAAAYTVLRTRSGRGEALADLASPSPGLRRARPGHLRAPGAVPPGRGPDGRDQYPPPAAAQPAARAADAPPAVPFLLRWRMPPAGRRLVSRVRRGRPARLALRVLIATALSTVAVAAAGSEPAAPALITGAVTWFLLTAPRDLAPPPITGRSRESGETGYR